jgi:hypothetical protein
MPALRTLLRSLSLSIDALEPPALSQTPEWASYALRKKCSLLAKAAQAAAKKREVDGGEPIPEAALSMPLSLTQPGTPLLGTPIRTDAPPFPVPADAPATPVAQAPPTLNAEDQAKISAVVAQLRVAETALEKATATAKPLKDAADAEEVTATTLEAAAAIDPIKKARAGTARRKAAAAAKFAAPSVKAMEEAASKRDAIQTRLDVLRASLSSAPTLIPAIAAYTPCSAPSNRC